MDDQNKQPFVHERQFSQHSTHSPPPMSQPMFQPPSQGYSPSPPPMYPQHPGQTYSPSPPPTENGRFVPVQYQQQPPMQHMQLMQYGPPQGQYVGNYPPGQLAPQQQQQWSHQQMPQQSHTQPQPQASEQQYTNPVNIANVSSGPAPVDCPSCRKRAMTQTIFVAGNTTHGWAAGACLCFLAGCIPYFISSLKDVEHRCSKCGALLAVWHRSGRTDVRMHG